MPLAMFRVDAGGGIGAGHAMRCIALAEALQAASWSVAFASSAETFASIDPLQQIPGERLILSSTDSDEPEKLRRHWPQGVDVCIVDHYGRDRKFEQRCRPWARQILVIDDLADREHDADVVVNPSARSADCYVGLVPQRCRVLVGAPYAIINDKFKPLRDTAMARRGSHSAHCIFISFGQNDTANATGDTLSALDMIGFAGEVHVVLGASAPYLSAVRAMMNGDRHLHVNACDMHRLMEKADLAIGAAGVTAWERCFLALPSVLVLLADNQRGNVAIVVEAGAGIDAGRADDGLRGRLAAILRGLVDDVSRLSAIGACAAALVDGRGTDRIVRALATT
jgi:UDP-2,4-diacetamido-2,4,6-trideoxy-beta-L-altropyranose hydrolase